MFWKSSEPDYEEYELSFIEIRNLYFDAVLEKEIESVCGNFFSWEFNGKAPKSRDSSPLLSVIVTKEDGTKESLVIDMSQVMNCKARQIDVENFEDDKTDKVKAFITDIILSVEKTSSDKKFLKKDVKKFSMVDIERILSVLSDEGIRAFEKNGILTVYIPQNM